ncbi:MAG: L,D-transpeptidase family protein [Clostridia bacterium]
MTNKTNRSRKKNTGEKVLLIGLLLVVAVLLCMVIYQHFRKGKDAPPSGTGTQAPISTPGKEPVWHEQSAPATNTGVSYTPPEGAALPYYIKVNRAMCTVTVYGIDANGEYTVPVKAFACSVGKEGDETILGEYAIHEPFGTTWCYMVDGTYSQYAYRIERGYMFHIVPSFENRKNTLETEEYNKLGSPASLGCIRLTTADAKWIQEHCAVGTKTLIYDDPQTPGPLGKPDTIKIPLEHEWAGWDPTDPDEENPWQKAVPRIEAADRTVPLGTESDLLQNVKAYDTCGNDITEKLYWYGKYTFDIAGSYQITLGVTDALGKNTEKTITITVSGEQEQLSSAAPTEAPTAAPAAVNLDKNSVVSEYALLMCTNDGSIFLDKNGDQQSYPASITKIMTVLLAAEKFTNPEDRLVITQETFDYLASRDASMARFPLGEGIRIIDLMYGSLLASGADASVTLANKIAGSEQEFAKLMNQKAAEIGMKNTNFANATGLHEENQYTTCHDVALLLQYALQNQLFKKIFTTTSYTTEALPGHPDGMTFKSTMFGALPEADLPNGIRIAGGKTGYTDNAGLCLASLAESTKTSNKYILVTMKAPGSYWDEPYPNHVRDALTVYTSIREG